MKKILLTIGLVNLLASATVYAAQDAAATVPAYVNENQTDPSPLKMDGVEGVVRGLGGDPMPRATVSLFAEHGHALITTAITDKDGKFRFQKIDKGPYRIVAHVDGLCTANIPILVEANVLAHHRLIITMQAKDLDRCSYAVGK